MTDDPEPVICDGPCQSWKVCEPEDCFGERWCPACIKDREEAQAEAREERRWEQ